MVGEGGCWSGAAVESNGGGGIGGGGPGGGGADGCTGGGGTSSGWLGEVTVDFAVEGSATEDASLSEPASRSTLHRLSCFNGTT